MARTINTETLIPVYLQSVEIERGPYAASNDQRWIRAFLRDFGQTPIGSITTRDLLGFRTRIAGKYKASTVNQYLGAARRLLEWSAALGYREPIDVRSVKFLRTPPPKPRSWTIKHINELLSQARRCDEQVFLWSAVQYLGVMRPSEVARLINGQGEWEQEGVFVPGTDKTFQKTGFQRRLIISPSGMIFLNRCEPRWRSQRTFWCGAKRTMGCGTHQFRHSAAQHLVDIHGYETAKWLLGHYSADQTTLRYARPDWQALRAKADCLASNLTMEA